MLMLAATVPACLAEEPGPAEGPKSVDLGPVFQKWALDTRSQGDRGTCSAVVVAAAIEYAAAGKQGRATRLSVEFLNWASNQVAGHAADGGFFADLWKGYAAYGICPEDDMPYRRHFDPALRPSKEALARAEEFRALALQLHWIKRWDPHQGLSDAQLDKVKRTLRHGWPVCGGFLWPKQERWQDGVLQMCPRGEVFDGHSVLLVGYRDDDTQPGGGVFLIRSSSGDRREGLMSYEYVRAYTNDAAWIGAGEGPLP